MATEPSLREPIESVSLTEASTKPPQGRRSFWRVSLGGMLIFAAGMMVGFAPMRAWLFLKDEPKQILIEAILFYVQKNENEKVRNAFSEVASSDASRNLDPLQILSSRTRTHRVLSTPTLTALIDQPLVLSYGSSVAPVTQPDGSVVFVPTAGMHMSFTPTVRPSGKLQLHYRTTYSADTSGVESPPSFNAVAVDSAIAVDSGVWRLVELESPEGQDVIDGRSRWLLLRMTEGR